MTGPEFQIEKRLEWTRELKCCLGGDLDGHNMIFKSRARDGREESAREKRVSPDTEGIVERHRRRTDREEIARCPEGRDDGQKSGQVDAEQSSFGKGQPGVLASSHGRSRRAEPITIVLRIVG